MKLLTNQFHYPNIYTVFDGQPNDVSLDYDTFRSGILTIITDMRDKIKISEDDIKTIFFILDEEEKGNLTI